MQSTASDLELTQAMGVAYDAAVVSAERSRKRAEVCLRLAEAASGAERISLIEIAARLRVLVENQPQEANSFNRGE